MDPVREFLLLTSLNLVLLSVVCWLAGLALRGLGRPRTDAVRDGRQVCAAATWCLLLGIAGIMCLTLAK